METIMFHKPVNVLVLLFICFIHMKKYVNCSIRVYLAHETLMCKPCVGAKLVRFQALIAHAFLNRSIPQIGMYIRINMSKTDFIYLKIWCDRVAFCQRGLFFYSPCTYILRIYNPPPPPPFPRGLVATNATILHIAHVQRRRAVYE